MGTNTLVRAATSVMVAVALVVTACSSDDSDTPSDQGSANAAPSTSATIVMTDNKFDTTKLTVPANQAVTVTVQNKGQAVHNWHVLNTKDAAGKDVVTQLLPGGQSETITFTLTAPGTLSFQCDTHPAEMKGSLTVQ